MATRLYFHQTSPIATPLPSDKQSANTATKSGANTPQVFLMDTTIGTGQTNDTVSSNANTSQQQTWYNSFSTETLDVAQTVGGGTATFNCADRESSLNANHWINAPCVYVWRPSTQAVVGYLTNPTASVGGLEPTSALQEQVTTFTFSTSAVSAQAGDVIVCEIWAIFTQATASAFTDIFYYDGTTETTVENTVVSNHASFLELAETLTFGTPVSADNSAVARKLRCLYPN